MCIIHLVFPPAHDLFRLLAEVEKGRDRIGTTACPRMFQRKEASMIVGGSWVLVKEIPITQINDAHSPAPLLSIRGLQGKTFGWGVVLAGGDRRTDGEHTETKEKHGN